MSRTGFKDWATFALVLGLTASTLVGAGRAQAGAASVYGVQDPLADRLVEACQPSAEEYGRAQAVQTHGSPDAYGQDTVTIGRQGIERLLLQTIETHKDAGKWSLWLSNLDNYKPTGTFAIFLDKTTRCFVRQLQNPRIADAPAAKPATSPPPRPPAPAPPASPSPPRLDPVEVAALEALDEVLNTPPEKLAKKPEDKKKQPIPLRLEEVQNSGTRCMKASLSNVRLDEQKEHWLFDWNLKNICATPQLFAAEINEHGPPPVSAIFDLSIGNYGQWYLWAPNYPPKLDFTPTDPKGYGNGPPVAPGAVLTRIGAGNRRSDDPSPIYVWLASCPAYSKDTPNDPEDAIANVMFRAASHLAYDPRVQCEPSVRLRGTAAPGKRP